MDNGFIKWLSTISCNLAHKVFQKTFVLYRASSPFMFLCVARVSSLLKKRVMKMQVCSFSEDVCVCALLFSFCGRWRVKSHRAHILKLHFSPFLSRRSSLSMLCAHYRIKSWRAHYIHTADWKLRIPHAENIKAAERRARERWDFSAPESAHTCSGEESMKYRTRWLFMVRQCS